MGDVKKTSAENLTGVIKSNSQESRLLFQIYLARIFAHNINVAYKNVVALQAQEELLQECAFDENPRKKASKSTKKNKAKKQPQQKKKQSSSATKSVKQSKPEETRG